jgi:two-component system sensor histidine kinase CpxA
MINFNYLHPGRRLVTRLFLWFWLTLLVTAAIAVWVGQTLDSEVELGTVNGQDLRKLTMLKERLEIKEDRNIPLGRVVDNLGMITRSHMVVIDVKSNRVLKSNGPPVHPSELKSLLQLINQPSVISISRGGVTFLGPAKFTYYDREYVLFIGRPNGQGPKSDNLLIWAIPAAMIMSIVFCYLFAKSIVQPIQKLQQTSQQLAKGDWDARVDIEKIRNDEIGQLARDFNTMAAHLSRLWHGQKRLLGDISHELRSPLARLQMALGLASQQNVDAPTLDRIEREAERMEALINQLLQLTRAESGSYQFETVALATLLQDIFNDAKFEAANVGKQVVVSEFSDIQVDVNVQQIQSAIENVIRNAIRYANKTVDVEMTVIDDYWQLTIKDDGPGLNADECERIFTPFYRPTVSRERESGGVGLGLAIANAAVQMHHGHIQALPRDNGGLCVLIDIPLKQPR